MDTQIHEGEALQNAAKMSKIGVHGLAENLGVPRSTLYYNFRKDKLDDQFKSRAAEALGLTLDQVFTGFFNNPAGNITGRMTGEDMRRRKAFGDEQEEGLTFVPVMAQAGYSRHYLDPTYVRDMEQVKIPNMPFRGERYRVFEVSGDSMEPTLKEHFYVVGERVDTDYWNSTAQFYIYVVVTEDRMMVKRLYRLDNEWYVCISDNEEFYPQFRLHKKDIKELWLVKRKIDWEMPPPKRFEIKIH
ncbi:MAG: S24 family peptidase [Sphingobacteriales bacterium]|nr:MAG: S24 family peptidase [Sphingobacteriales bacterium]